MSGISDTGPDLLYWDDVLNKLPYDERNWLDAPWIITEYYFYRRVASAFKFFETGYDMFVPQKFAGLVSAMSSIEDISSRMPTILSSSDSTDALTLAVQTSLWGNKIDLSLWPASGPSKSTSNQYNEAGRISSASLLKDTLPYILDDQTADVVNYLTKSSCQEIGIVVDNAGYELFSDLLLGHVLLSLGLTERVTFHTKVMINFLNNMIIELILFD